MSFVKKSFSSGRGYLFLQNVGEMNFEFDKIDVGLQYFSEMI